MTALAKSAESTASNQVTAISTRFTQDADKVITDNKTGLQWYDASEDCYGEEAKYWAADLAVSPGGWRLATREELHGLYPEAVSTGLFSDIHVTIPIGRPIPSSLVWRWDIGASPSSMVLNGVTPAWI